MTLQTQGVGYDDLNKFLKNPSNLEFIIELVKVEQPEEKKAHDIEWNSFNVHPLLLNYAQCELLLGDSHAATEHCSTVLQSDPDNVEALYRRGNAHVGAWDPAEARADLQRAAQLDSGLNALVQRELNTLDDMVRRKDQDDKENMPKMFE